MNLPNRAGKSSGKIIEAILRFSVPFYHSLPEGHYCELQSSAKTRAAELSPQSQAHWESLGPWPGLERAASRRKGVQALIRQGKDRTRAWGPLTVPSPQRPQG